MWGTKSCSGFLLRNSNGLVYFCLKFKAKGKGDLTTYQVLNQRKTKKVKESKLKKKIIEHMPGFLNYNELIYINSLQSNQRILSKIKG
jgi:hypothetical protein